MASASRLVVGALVALLLFMIPAGARGDPNEIPEQFIVELKPGVDRDAFLARHRIRARHRYHILRGFAGRLPEALRKRLAADPDVATISPDLIVHTFQGPDLIPTGVRRVGANLTDLRGLTGAGVNVAVIDTGIDCTHPDLAPNCKGGINLVNPSLFPVDDNGHGTHVAGIIAAVQNGSGVQGVAPGASLWAVKVLDATGSGSLSTVISGIDWAALNGMQVANVSLGAFDSSGGAGAICRSVANAVAVGLTVVAAAGNSSS